MSRSGELIDHYQRTHASRVYGTSSVKYVRFLRPEIRVLAPRSILDFGCGQSLFLECLKLGQDVELMRYDPAIPEFATKPSVTADLLVCIDVLEHIEEKDLDTVLSSMRVLCREAIIVVDTKPAKHKLPDGQNAHVTLKPHDWWRERIGRHFRKLQPVTTARSSRASFKTWERSLPQTLRFHALRLSETVAHFARRLTRRHKQHWKVSAVRAPE